MGTDDITGVILAGGRSTRMGQDKGVISAAGKMLFEHIADRLRPMVGEILINSNQNASIYGQHFNVVPDITQDYAGPLAGMLAGLKAINTEWALFVPCDVPSFPLDLAKQFVAHSSQHSAVYARDALRDHPTLCLLNKNIVPALESYLAQGERKVMLFLKQINALPVEFNDPQAFANLNTPADVALWEKTLGQPS
ncbi:MAG: molybdenum cofactor guanylyltransferase MobA [Ewingella americana]|jgi:molybdopterin-guanine dinucleotide biosynthesis protein A|uniref:molybdenum cofactor guanylyltransferase MobA n=1 Tax=Ewingella americana TaxID=41202 RepID=UPI002432E352|nr:molybdenum cofactor guanylyltransferase MobA [Ewingella americana]MCI1680426.1 molybdenum cofactor guanylyltransferase MobA [Ewingella americana]MCI1856276.1 molybdenum cofactor guanylyltransferase MobA [Ewingella americana]MCI1864007.1 molybdenum cofactor guanylyltransferase MobA [Ewingella americana]MCI2142955.1 molybdenum cofactor guanylyltransferase MobA [Ewingella americana]MCI2163840.1 molybdenum cofactor guanylyltransferase MobA [Ewingella americana]